MMLIRQKKRRPRGQPAVDDGPNGKPKEIQRWENEGGAIPPNGALQPDSQDLPSKASGESWDNG